jgi:hypothetical protein
MPILLSRVKMPTLAGSIVSYAIANRIGQHKFAFSFKFV